MKSLLRTVLAAAAFAALAACSDSTGPSDGFTAKAVAAAATTTCAIDNGGRLYCWGSDHLSGAMMPQRRFAALSSQSGTCALSDAGEVSCWDDSPYHVYELPGDYRLRSISGDGDHGCGITTAGSTVCWDYLSVGQVLTEPAFTEVSSVWDHACGLTAAGEAYCWGWNREGGLGDGTLTDRQKPARVATSVRFARVATAPRLSCGLTADGRVYCWGDGTNMAIGVPDAARPGCTPLPEPAWFGCTVPQELATDLRFTQIIASQYRVCGLAQSGTPYCWGRDLSRSLGVPNAAVTFARCGIEGAAGSCTPVPTAVSGSTRFRSLGALGTLHTCGITGRGSVRCWGGVTGDGWPIGILNDPDQGSATPVRLPAPDADAVLVR